MGHRGDFLYEDLEFEYNKISRNFMICNRESNIEIVVDDDQVFSQNDPKKDTYGLRHIKHVRITEMATIVIVLQQHALYFQLLSIRSSKVNHPTSA
jgi:hypothetical protein